MSTATSYSNPIKTLMIIPRRATFPNSRFNDVVRVNGRVTIIDTEELEKMEVQVSLYDMDERSQHLQGIVIEVDESYTHCPRAFKFSESGTRIR
ncbi:MAG: hypothetical protein CM1200mP35_07990 [Chloroflexota bacterium]|nr:MAG: hypothetical protein CM1200mP35_07990 [Chloroflexota bacterium]